MKTIKDYLANQVDNRETPSIQYIFFDTDTIIYEFSRGLSDVKTGTPIDSSTMVHLFSITKTFTALSVLQLAQAGKVELDKPVADYLPEFPYSKSITVEQLLSHTSGIPNPLPLRWIHRVEEHDGFERDNFFKKVFDDNPELKFRPGAKFMYSNLGYVILGQLIERISGLSFEEYVQENIIARIGLNQEDLTFTLNPSRHAVGYHKWLSLSNFALGFLIDKKKFMGVREGIWKPFYPFYNNGVAYGGLFGTGRGLVKYAQALIKTDSDLLNNQHKEILLTECMVKGKPTGMAHSWFTGSLKGNVYYAHAGGGGGYYVELRIYPELGVGSVIMFNRSGMTDERILDQTDKTFITEKSNSK